MNSALGMGQMLTESAVGITVGVGFGRRSFLCDVARELQRAVGGCATLHLPDGRMVSSQVPSTPKPKPRFPPSRGFFTVGFGR
jgi:hypothetical protein